MPHAPQGTQTEGALFTTNAIVSLCDIVSIHEALDKDIVSHRSRIKHREKATFDVKPPLSGLFRTALRVLKNLGSEGFMKNTSGIIMTLESSTSVSSYDCPKICRSLFHALCMICS